MSFRHLFAAMVLGFVFAYAVGAVSPAAAQQGGVVISLLVCDTDPETVTISNEGDEAQDLEGWALQSDPVDEESFDLTPVGSLPPSASVTVSSGPAAEGLFVWSQRFVFRDGDPADFARLVDADGNVVHQVPCSRVDTEPSPAPTEQPDGLPDGGGPPGIPGGGVALAMVAGGGVLAAVGALLMSAALLLGSTVSAVRTAGTARDAEAEPPVRKRQEDVEQMLAYMLVAVLVLVFVIKLRR